MNLGKENEQQEFKLGLAQLDKGLKSLSAMLNRQQKGTVYFGDLLILFSMKENNTGYV